VASVRTANPINVGVDNQLSRGAVENQAKVNHASNVAVEALQRNKV
jgi:hypothetical protein